MVNYTKGYFLKTRNWLEQKYNERLRILQQVLTDTPWPKAFSSPESRLLARQKLREIVNNWLTDDVNDWYLKEAGSKLDVKKMSRNSQLDQLIDWYIGWMGVIHTNRKHTSATTGALSLVESEVSPMPTAKHSAEASRRTYHGAHERSETLHTDIPMGPSPYTLPGTFLNTTRCSLPERSPREKVFIFEEEILQDMIVEVDLTLVGGPRQEKFLMGSLCPEYKPPNEISSYTVEHMKTVMSQNFNAITDLHDFQCIDDAYVIRFNNSLTVALRQLAMRANGQDTQFRLRVIHTDTGREEMQSDTTTASKRRRSQTTADEELVDGDAEQRQSRKWARAASQNSAQCETFDENVARSIVGGASPKAAPRPTEAAVRANLKLTPLTPLTRNGDHTMADIEVDAEATLVNVAKAGLAPMDVDDASSPHAVSISADTGGAPSSTPSSRFKHVNDPWPLPGTSKSSAVVLSNVHSGTDDRDVGPGESSTTGAAMDTTLPMEINEDPNLSQIQVDKRAREEDMTFIDSRTVKRSTDSFFFLPMAEQPEEVRNNAVMLDEDSWVEQCKFNEEESQPVDILELMKINVVFEGKTNSYSAQKDEGVNDMEPAEARSGDYQPEVAEHWTQENYLGFCRFFKFEVKDLIGHGRALINVPGISRYAFQFQLFGAYWIFYDAFASGTIGKVIAEQPGAGKATEWILSVVLWWIVSPQYVKVLDDREQQEMSKGRYKAKHLPSNHERGARCPSADQYPVQCLCEWEEEVFNRFWPCEGHTILITNLSQFLDPGILELHRMLSTTDSKPDFRNTGFGSGSIKIRACHNEAARGASDNVREAVQVNPDKDMKHLLPSYEPEFEESQLEELEREKWGPYDENSLLETTRMEFWRHVYNPKAPSMVLVATPQGVKSGLPGLPKSQFATWNAITQPNKPEKKVYIKRNDHCRAMPSVVAIDEAHVAFTKETSEVTNALDPYLTRYAWFQDGVQPFKPLYISGTPCPKSVGESLGPLLRICQKQALDFRGEDWNDEEHPCHILRQASITEHRMKCQSVRTAFDSIVRKLAEDQSTGVDTASIQNKEVRDRMGKDMLRIWKEENIRATKIIKLVMIRRATTSKMFGISLGHAVDITPVYIEPSQETVDLMNAPAHEAMKGWKKRIGKVDRHAGNDQEEPQTDCMERQLLSHKSFTIASALPGYAEVAAEFKRTEDERCESNNLRVSWHPDRHLRKIKWSELTDEQRNAANVLKYNNIEAKDRGFLTKWPLPPHPFFKRYYKRLLRVGSEADDKKIRQDRSLNVQERYQGFARWVEDVWTKTDNDGQPTKGAFATEHTFILLAYYAYAYYELSQPGKPFFIHENVKHHFFTIDAYTWSSYRAAAIQFVDDRKADVFKSKFMNGEYVKGAEKSFQDIWKCDDDFRPRFVGFTGVAAEGHSLLTFTEMMILAPFEVQSKTTQAASRPQRIISKQKSKIRILYVPRSIFDTLTWGKYLGPEGLNKLLKDLRSLVDGATG